MNNPVSVWKPHSTSNKEKDEEGQSIRICKSIPSSDDEEDEDDSQKDKSRKPGEPLDD